MKKLALTAVAATVAFGAFATTSSTEVQAGWWGGHGYYGGGYGVGVGFAAGALIGGVIAASTGAVYAVPAYGRGYPAYGYGVAAVPYIRPVYYPAPRRRVVHHAPARRHRVVK